MLRAFADGIRIAVAAGGEAYYRTHGAERVSVGSDLYSESKLRSGMRVLEKLTGRLEELGRMERHQEALGFAYRQLALFGYQHLQPELARECLRRGERYSGSQPVSPTALGRLLERLVGLERKENIAHLLARAGVMSAGRRLRARRARLREDGEE